MFAAAIVAQMVELSPSQGRLQVRSLFIAQPYICENAALISQFRFTTKG